LSFPRPAIGGGRDALGRRRVQPTRIPIERQPPDPEGDAAELAERVSRVSGGASRAAVLGVNDGLVTNVCLILAVAGAHASSASVRLAGFASLLAGSFSMAAGEWVSVKSQVELYMGLLGEVRKLISRSPRLILDELSSHLESAGFGRATAQTAAAELPLDEERFLQFTAQTVFGINSSGLGSPVTAAVTSLAYFAIGAIVPLLPWFFTKAGAAVALSIGLTAFASSIAGSVVAQLSERPVLVGAARQLAIVAAASGITFGIGHLFGAVVG
jgi:VIT1/CCC1 family predicted Fe2+/Mn2+ transporter